MNSTWLRLFMLMRSAVVVIITSIAMLLHCVQTNIITSKEAKVQHCLYLLKEVFKRLSFISVPSFLPYSIPIVLCTLSQWKTPNWRIWQKSLFIWKTGELGSIMNWLYCNSNLKLYIKFSIREWVCSLNPKRTNPSIWETPKNWPNLHLR